MPADWFAALWNRIARELADDVAAEEHPSHGHVPLVTVADVDVALARWARREHGPARDAALDILLARRTRLTEEHKA